MNCSKKRLFAKRFYSKRIANVDAESDETTEKGCNSIISASESELAFLAIDAIPRPLDSILPVAASVKKLEVLNAAAGKIRFIQITLRCRKTFFKATVDTGSPASFVNKQTVDFIIKSVP